MTPLQSCLLLLILAWSPGCGPTVGDDEGSGSGSSDTTTETTESIADSGSGAITATEGTDTAQTTDPTSTGSETGPVDCNELGPDSCSAFRECHNVAGSEVTPTKIPGEYTCSDIGLPFACIEATECETYFGVVCRVDDPTDARWLVEMCVPQGWEPCGTCV